MEGPGNAYADTYLRWKKRFVLENFREHGQRWRGGMVSSERGDRER